MSEKSCITINCGCCGGGTGSSGDGTPVGTIISYMGTKAPEHYLICDGAVISIADYPYLADQIKAEFGAADYFGGDGTTTFGVPDLRGEFLRGTGTNGTTLLVGGTVGKNQKPTLIPNIKAYNTNGSGHGIGGYTGEGRQNFEGESKKSNGYVGIVCTLDTGQGNLNQTSSYATRPTNTGVLYCIKYE